MEKGTTILFGLPGVAVVRVERVSGEDGEAVRLVHVTTAASGGGLSGLRSDVDVGEAVPDNSAAGSALRRGVAGHRLAHASIPVP
jgi:hypothetical protein